MATPESSQQQKPDHAIEVTGIPDDQSHEDARPHADMTFEELLSPIHKQVKESGITEEELDDLFEEIRKEVWQEKQKKSGLL